MEGLIIKNISNDYTVLANNNYYNCKARGRFRKDNIIPLVGDHVVFDEKEKYPNVETRVSNWNEIEKIFENKRIIK